MTNDAAAGDPSRTQLNMGYQVIRTDRDAGTFSCLGHTGVGGSVGFVHRPTNMSVAVMLNKADAGQDVTMRILRLIADHYNI